MERDPDAGDETRAPHVTGRIIIKPQVPPFSGAVAHIYLEDVSRADGEADVLAEAVIRDVKHGSSGDEAAGRAGAGDTSTEISFALLVSSGTVIDPRSEYAVRVWVDSDGDGSEGPGDLYSDERYSVLTRGLGRDVTVTLGQRQEASGDQALRSV
jgi:hypothetical protein